MVLYVVAFSDRHAPERWGESENFRWNPMNLKRLFLSLVVLAALLVAQTIVVLVALLVQLHSILALILKRVRVCMLVTWSGPRSQRGEVAYAGDDLSRYRPLTVSIRVKYVTTNPTSWQNYRLVILQICTRNILVRMADIYRNISTLSISYNVNLSE